MTSDMIRLVRDKHRFWWIMAGSSINLWKSTLTSFLHFLDSLVRSALFLSLALLHGGNVKSLEQIIVNCDRKEAQLSIRNSYLET